MSARGIPFELVPLTPMEQELSKVRIERQRLIEALGLCAAALECVLRVGSKPLPRAQREEYVRVLAGVRKLLRL